jgi:acyl carrier protein
MTITIFSKIQATIVKILKVTENEITENTKSSEIKKWDSLAHINIIIDLENKFKKKVSTSKIDELDSVEKLIKYFK